MTMTIEILTDVLDIPIVRMPMQMTSERAFEVVQAIDPGASLSSLRSDQFAPAMMELRGALEEQLAKTLGDLPWKAATSLQAVADELGGAAVLACSPDLAMRIEDRGDAPPATTCFASHRFLESFAWLRGAVSVEISAPPPAGRHDGRVEFEATIHGDRSSVRAQVCREDVKHVLRIVGLLRVWTAPDVHVLRVE